MYYIRKIDNNNFSFLNEEVNSILDTDIEISSETYNKFFELQSEGKQFKIKDINSSNFEDMFEEFINDLEDSSGVAPEEVLSKSVSNLTLDSKKKDILIANLAKTVNNLTIELNKIKGGIN